MTIHDCRAFPGNWFANTFYPSKNLFDPDRLHTSIACGDHADVFAERRPYSRVRRTEQHDGGRTDRRRQMRDAGIVPNKKSATV
jgi:hypothetical protein